MGGRARLVRLLRDFKTARWKAAAGGETTLFQLTTAQLRDLFKRNMDLCLVRGRWAATSSARVYIQAGRALLVKTRIPAKAAELGDRMAKDLFRAMTAAWELGKPVGRS